MIVENSHEYSYVTAIVNYFGVLIPYKIFHHTRRSVCHKCCPTFWK